MRYLGKIGNTFRLSIYTIICITLSICLALFMLITSRYLKEQEERIRRDYKIIEIERARQSVENFTSIVDNHAKEIEELLEEKVRERTEEGYYLLEVIYDKNKDKSRKEIIKIIQDTLGEVRFDGGKGYYFAGDLVEESVVLSYDDENINRLIVDFPENERNYIGGMVELVRDQKKGFYSYSWLEAGSDRKVRGKRSYLMGFEPLNIWIGSGEHLANVEQEVKEELIHEVDETSNNIFILDQDGIVLNSRKNIYGEKENNLLGVDQDGKIRLPEKILNEIEDRNEGYLECPEGNKSTYGGTYVKNAKKWGWRVASNINLEELKAKLIEEEKRLEENTNKTIKRVIFIIIALIGITYLLEKYFLGKVNYFIEKEKSSYETLINLSLDGIYTGDMNMKILDCNESAPKMLGYKRSEILKMTLAELIYNDEIVIEDIRSDNEYKEVLFKKKDETSIYVEVNMRVVKEEKMEYWIAYVRDISEKKLMEDELRTLSVTDELTKLYNRREILTLLKKEIDKNLPIKKSTLCLVMLDIDHFKKINDTYGHHIGDRVLVEFSNTMKASVRGKDYVGRYGGEEFLMILPETDLESGMRILKRVQETLEDVIWKEESMRVTFSGGIIEIDLNKEVDIQKKLVEVDELLYRAKENGRNRIEV